MSSRRSRGPSLVSIPPELIHQIFSHFRPSRREEANTLKNLTLSHSSLRPIAQTVRWASVHLTWDWLVVDTRTKQWWMSASTWLGQVLEQNTDLRPLVKELLLGNAALTDMHTVDVLSQFTSVGKLKIQGPLATREIPDKCVYGWVDVFPQVVGALTQYIFPTITSLWLENIADFRYQLLVHCPVLEELILEKNEIFFAFVNDEFKSSECEYRAGMPSLEEAQTHWLSPFHIAFVYPLSGSGIVEEHIFGIVGPMLTTMNLSYPCFNSKNSWNPTVLKDILSLINFPNLQTLALACNNPFDDSTLKMIRWLVPNIARSGSPFHNLHLSFLAGYPPLAPVTTKSNGSDTLRLWANLDEKLAFFIQKVTIRAEYFGTIGKKRKAWEMQRLCLEGLFQTLGKMEGVLVFEEKLSEEQRVGPNALVNPDDSDWDEALEDSESED
ncbi:hypothetical protein DL96DRAFT_1590437 [Flagelloscypha sp. PMI_526]|nr:hypothetical protein DL96DRAFT_1590437 [Flagelloscypha sp. PMI_526]